MDNKFTEVMSKKADEQLIQIVSVWRKDYELEAIEAAEQELKKRGVDAIDYNKVEDEYDSFIEKIEAFNATKASTVARIVHLVVDFIAICFLVVLFSDILPLEPVAESSFDIVGLLLFVIICFGYYVPLEYKFQKSLGKFITKTRVVTSDGHLPTLGDIVKRTACRFIPFDKISFVFSRNGFHDNYSNTVVVKDHK
jgi:uncharacterized RDD family membrane protein YckC